MTYITNLTNLATFINIVTLNLKPAITRLTAAEVRVLVSRARSVEIGGGGGGTQTLIYVTKGL